MRSAMIAISTGLLALAAPAMAQDGAAAPADANRITFDLGTTESSVARDAWGIGDFVAQQGAAEPVPTCTSDSDIIDAQASAPQRYDDNGAPIRRTAATCSLDRQAAASTSRQDRLAIMREGQCEEREDGYTCANSGRLGNGTFERETSCRETGTTRNCGGSVSWGSSSEGRNAAREALDALQRD